MSSVSTSAGSISPGDELIQSLTLYKGRHWFWHLHVLPYTIVATIGWIYFWLFSPLGYSFDDHYEAAMISLVALALLQILLFLSCHWSVHVQAAMSASSVKRIADADIAKVVPQPNNGSSELVRILRSSPAISTTASGPAKEIWIVFQKLKYVWDEEKKMFRSVQFPTNESLSFYAEWKGNDDSDDGLATKEKHFGNNE